MEKRKREREAVPTHEFMAVSACLAAVGGFLDVYTYLTRGGVFANAQTGNLVLFGISAAERKPERVLYYLIPVVAFFFGVLATEAFKRRFSDEEFGCWQKISVAVELVLLLAVGLLPAGVPDAAVNVTISFVSSMQINSFRKVSGLPYASTMCTGNLRSGTEQLCLFLFDRRTDALPKSLRYFAIIAVFCLGAASGTLLTGLWGEKSVLVCCALLLAVLGIILRDERGGESPRASARR